MLCTEFRESDNSNLIVTNSISISITGRTEFPVNERYVSPDRRRDRITLRYTYQVRCAATFISLSCSELCFPVDSVNFECGGNQEIICLPGYTINTSPNGEGGPCMACIPSIPGCPGYGKLRQHSL